MSFVEDLPLALLVVGVIPLVWSGAVLALRAGALRIGSMRLEIAALALMIAPAAVGGILLASPPLTTNAPLAVLDLSDIVWEQHVAIEPPIGDAPTTRDAPSGLPAGRLLSMAIVAIYLAGLAVCAIRLGRARLRLGRITRASAPAPDLGDRVRLTDKTLSPFAAPCGAIVLPRALAETLPASEVALIVRHERAHVDRGDMRTYWALAVVDAALWFNPFVRRQTGRCRLAAELACDAAVVAGAPQRRGDYARALLAAMKHAAAGLGLAPSIVSLHKTGEHRMRLTQILSGAPERRGPAARLAILAAGLLAVPVGALQLVACAQSPAARAGDPVAEDPAAPASASAARFVVIAANEDALGVERADDRISLTGPLTLHTGESTIMFDRIDIQLAPESGEGRAGPSVTRIESPRAEMTRGRSDARPDHPGSGPPIEVDADEVTASETVVMENAVFTLGCGGTLSLPAGLGELPMGDCATSEEPERPRYVADDPQAQPWDAALSAIPVEGRVTSRFGRRVDPITGQAQHHSGMDFGAPEGTPVAAMADGRVTFVGWRGGYGRVVELDHGGDVKTRYAQLSAADVARDDQITAGQMIGRVGQSGRATGPHLHFELWYAGEVYDPMPALEALGFEGAAP